MKDLKKREGVTTPKNRAKRAKKYHNLWYIIHCKVTQKIVYK